MKYKDYYQILGVDKNAGADDIKSAYRKLAKKYHPDVSKEKGAEAKFKDINEAYQTLKDTEKRAAYDNLGSYRPGDDVRPPPDWARQYAGAAGSDGAQFSFDDVDLSDLFEGFRGAFGRRGAGGGRRHGGAKVAIPGQDFEVVVHITVEEAYHGKELKLELTLPEVDAHGMMHRVPNTVTVRLPKGATDGQRLRVPGKGSKGANGGRDGDLYLNIVLHPHPVYRVTEHDIYLDLPLAPWEAVLGTSIEVPTPGGTVRLKIPPGTHAGQKLRLPKRGLPKPGGEHGDLYTIAQIVVPTVLTEHEQSLYKELSEGSRFNPRANLEQEIRNASRAH
jgi:curved DNA-binding protein